ncbi:MAG: hypothetical protein ACXWEY_11395 [Bacteroidia bacterium]
MKKLVLIAYSLAVFALFACSKPGSDSNDNSEDLYKNSPSSLVPNSLAPGSWFFGTISAISYWDRDGHQLGNDHEAGREFKFYNVNGQGRLKFWQYLGTRNSASCVTEYFTFKEGTVKFEDNKFTFYPVKGNFKTIKKDCSSNNGTTERNATGEDLKPFTFRWEIRNINGEPTLYTFNEDDINLENPVFVYSLAH